MPVAEQSGFGVINYLVLIAYFALLIWMGFFFSRRAKSTDDFFLAGRRIPWWASGISIYATQLSAITFMAIPAKVYATNWVYFLANMCIVLVAPAVIYLYLPFYRRLDLTTAYEYLEMRFNLATRLFGSCAYILFQIGRMAIVLFLPAIALSTVTGINIFIALVLMGVLCTLYTVLGGIEAVIWSDVLQAVVLLGGALLSWIIICFKVDGGMAAIIQTGLANDKFHMFDWTWDWTTTAVWVVLFGNILNNLIPYTADQTVVQRYLTTKNEREAAKAIWTNALLTIPGSLVFFGIGTALFVFYNAHPHLLDPSMKTDAIFPMFIVQQLPIGVSGLVIGGLFAAAMSSLDSSMNSVSAVVVTDFYRRLKPNPSEHFCLNLARSITVILGVVATGVGCVMAVTEFESVWDLFIKILGLFGASLAGLFILGMFTRRTNAYGALTGAITSAVVLFFAQQTQVHFFLYGAIGILTCVLVGYCVSLIVPTKDRTLEGLTIYSMRPQENFLPR